MKSSVSVFQSDFGFDEGTIFSLCSLTKAMTAAAVGILLDEGKLKWDTPVKDVLPTFQPKNDTLYNCLTITDLLFNPSGMSCVDNLVIRLLLFRAQFSYNNLSYALAGNVIEEFPHEPPSDTSNVAKCYNSLDDITTCPIPCPKAGNDRFAGPSGVRHRYNVYDGLALQASGLPHLREDSDGTAVAKQGADGLDWHQWRPLARQHAYHRKGCSLFAFLFHQGSLPGALSIVMILSNTDNVIVGLSNSLALDDVSDWVGRLFFQKILNVPSSERVDFIAAAYVSVAENLKWYPQLVTELGEARKNGTSPRALHEYAGTYWEAAHVFKIVVTAEEGGLYWAFHGLDSEKFKLNHYEDDDFTWLLPHNELSRRGRWVGSNEGPLFWKAVFKSSSEFGIDTLAWAHDTDVPPLQLKKEQMRGG
ncbi:hypothetical protein BR93DRAFT_941136 [Coniochaeta sp. PMI_546]|nr:hypothetical protein BR93DRAFT_941136 [Coniochaeta sp. PMI_546]